MHEYSVEIRVLGTGLNPDDITRELALTPSFVHKAQTCSEKSIWGYGGKNTSHIPVYWSSLEEGINHLLDDLAGLEDKLANYKASWEVILWCGHFQSSFDGGPHLSCALLKRLGNFGVGLFIDNYFSE